MQRDHFGESVVYSLRAVWALICRVSGTGNLEEGQESVRSELKGDDEGYQLIDWDEVEAEEEVDLPEY